MTSKYKKYGKGWFKESHRHSLARQGIKTGRKNYSKNSHSDIARELEIKKEQEQIEREQKQAGFELNEWRDVIDDETFQQFLKELGYESDDVSDVTEDESGVLRVEVGSEEWYVFDDDDRAEQFALERVSDDLENEPELFSQDWLQGYMTIYDTDRRIIADEESDARLDGMDEDDILEDADYKDEYDELQEKIDELRDEKEVDKLEEEQENLISSAKDKVKDKYYDEIYDSLKDPVAYFVDEQGIYSREDLLKQPFISIDIDEAAKDAVNTDGWQHFVATYDGNSTELDNEKVIVRLN